MLFDKLETITYNNKLSKNIMTRAAYVRQVISKYKIFYKYQIDDGERPDTIAHDYYGDARYDWLVCITNNIFSIPSDWPKTYDGMLAYLQEKYGQVNQLMSTIDHYEYTGVNKERITYTLSPITYNNMESVDRFGWHAVYVYDNEQRINDKKRQIKLISNEYIPQINKELDSLF